MKSIDNQINKMNYEKTSDNPLLCRTMSMKHPPKSTKIHYYP